MGFQKLFPNEDIDFNSPSAVHIYTDGSCIGNGRPDAVGGWAYLIHSPEGISKMSGGEYGTTNNRMEMMAVISALRSANPDLVTTVYSDSQYVIKTLNGLFKIGKNHDLWAVLKSEVRRFEHIQFVWVKGHADNEYNNEVDRLANGEAMSRKRKH